MGADVEQLAEPLRTAVKGLLAEANAGSSTPRVVISSAFRTRAEQQALWDANPDPARVAPPGTSKHEQGRAVDFGGDLALVAKLAPKYGLAATVPGEPWHYESTFGSSGKGVSVGDVAGAAVDAIPGVGTVVGGAKAVGSFVEAATNPRTWLRALGAVSGVLLVVLGLRAIASDLGVKVPLTPTGLARQAVGDRLSASERAAVGETVAPAASASGAIGAAL